MLFGSKVNVLSLFLSEFLKYLFLVQLTTRGYRTFRRKCSHCECRSIWRKRKYYNTFLLYFIIFSSFMNKIHRSFWYQSLQVFRVFFFFFSLYCPHIAIEYSAQDQAYTIDSSSDQYYSSLKFHINCYVRRIYSRPWCSFCASQGH